ncbi:hypothetical protein CNMCM8980_003977 [Aspergillus fumigatiaffinis]|nr:hypothetical protein CNMCM8980_003977 [Aspergillus fumigatiaffinis]
MNPIPFVPRHKAGDRLEWASLAPEPEDKENRVPAPAPVGKRRRVECSDSILQEQNGKGKQRRTSAEAGKASEEAPVSEPPFSDDEDFDAILAAELEVDDDIGDEEYVPSPADIEDDFFGKVETEPEIIAPSMGANRDFVALLQNLISELAQWAEAHDVSNMDNEDKAITIGYWSLLRRLSVDFAVSLFLPGIPEEVQALSRKGKKEWSLEDFLSLPFAEDDGRQGIYANFATGDLRRKDEECDVYVGSSRHLKQRIERHLLMAKKFLVRNLPEGDKRSFHYRQICRDGVQSDFRRLAAFDCPIEPGYLLLLEGIFMILFNTYQYPGYCSAFATRSSYRLTEKIRKDLDIPSVPWRGMNAAWPLRQGFFNVGAQSASPCCNPACDRMTYPEALRPEGAAKYTRQSGDPGNPLGPYLCGICFRYKSWHGGVLPDKDVLGKFQGRLEARAEAGPDAACHCCGKLESQVDEHSMTSRKGEKVLYTRRWRIHALIPKKLLCDACWAFVDKNKRLRTPEEVLQYLQLSNLIATRAAGGEIQCDNCGAVENPSKRGHIANAKAKMVLCARCDNTFRTQGKLRDASQDRRLERKEQLRADRQAGKQIICSNPHCGKIETPDKPFIVNGTSFEVLCKPCNDCFRKKGEHRIPKT